METRANHIWVGAVTLMLLACLAAFLVWLARIGGNDNREYDIFFEQSVGGLANGSQVTFAGVPAGQVDEIELWRQNPEFVRVRVSLNDDIPILQGTVASISASFTGVSNVSLDGAVRGAPVISELGPEGVPVIPAEPGVIGEILASAPLLLERVATLTDRLTRVLSDENQDSISGILANTDRMSGQLADASPQIATTLAELQATLAQSTKTLGAFERTLETTDALLNSDGAGLATEMRTTLQSVQRVAATLQVTLDEAGPLTHQLATTTLPSANAMLDDLKRTSAALRQVTEKVESHGAGALVGGSKLPDYKP